MMAAPVFVKDFADDTREYGFTVKVIDHLSIKIRETQSHVLTLTTLTTTQCKEFTVEYLKSKKNEKLLSGTVFEGQ